jgi:hypothetical protein
MALLAASGAASATEHSGHFYNSPSTKTKTTLPNGNISIQEQYYQLSRSDHAADPLSETAGNCFGNVITTKEGKVLSGSGFCYQQDDQGNGTTLSWKTDEVGTAKCPTECGTWRYVDGYGKFKGTTGNGTWVETRRFADGASLGTFTGNYKTP